MPRASRTVAIVLAVATALTVGLPSGAFAAGDDGVVRVPSDSPAGAEYSLPLDSARRTGEPRDSGRGPEPATNAFGEGVTSAGTSPAPSPSTAAATPKSSSSRRDPEATPTSPAATTTSPASADGGSVPTPATIRAEATGSGGPGPLLLGGIIVVAVLGLGGFAVLRRGRVT
ncbi:MAG: hypothetical protein AAGC46_10255 [Solirubrobacteraceae bacterium]|nr:hypothetical protein [Patulibacter sp.]